MCLILVILLISCDKNENFFSVEGITKLQIQTAKSYKEIMDKEIINEILSKINELKYTKDSNIDINGWQYRIKLYDESEKILYDATFCDDTLNIDDEYYSIDNSSYEILKNIYDELSVKEKNIYE